MSAVPTEPYEDANGMGAPYISHGTLVGTSTSLAVQNQGVVTKIRRVSTVPGRTSPSSDVDVLGMRQRGNFRPHDRNQGLLSGWRALV